jgi:hypothetical protein
MYQLQRGPDVTYTHCIGILEKGIRLPQPCFHHVHGVYAGKRPNASAAAKCDRSPYIKSEHDRHEGAEAMPKPRIDVLHCIKQQI